MVRVEEEEKLAQAFDLVRRYELYCLVRGWGAVVIAIGIGAFLTSWALSSAVRDLVSLLVYGELGDWLDEWYLLLFHQANVAQFFVFEFVVFVVSGIIVATHSSVVRIAAKNQEIVRRRMRLFGLSLFILFALTFQSYVVRTITFWLAFGPVPWDFLMSIPIVRGFLGFNVLISGLPPSTFEMLGVFSVYWLLRAETSEYDFREVRSLGFMLLVLCFVEFGCRLVFSFLWNTYVVLWLPSGLILNVEELSYILLGFALPALYVVGGWKSWRRAREVLAGTYGSW